ncbi:hypothetical protein THAOC_13106 [Thalassiosira oceanica]|uniref:Uncharacterized protein n=1 Tax=Thalassiosira oceanica TaxID=159749 RepID=K0SIE3_THAOC|nr:hypothetical protein THAOC_13106 [Thalassiosira oceanica]|eukprot:EJK65998.1 hypothetical protein THAOC_13106 [Thalassiosira oceanica]
MPDNHLSNRNHWETYLGGLCEDPDLGKNLVEDEGLMTIDSLREIGGRDAWKVLVKKLGVVKKYDNASQTWVESSKRFTGLLSTRLLHMYDLYTFYIETNAAPQITDTMMSLDRIIKHAADRKHFADRVENDSDKPFTKYSAKNDVSKYLEELKDDISEYITPSGRPGSYLIRDNTAPAVRPAGGGLAAGSPYPTGSSYEECLVDGLPLNDAKAKTDSKTLFGKLSTAIPSGTSLRQSLNTGAGKLKCGRKGMLTLIGNNPEQLAWAKAVKKANKKISGLTYNYKREGIATVIDKLRNARATCVEAQTHITCDVPTEHALVTRLLEVTSGVPADQYFSFNSARSTLDTKVKQSKPFTFEEAATDFIAVCPYEESNDGKPTLPTKTKGGEVSSTETSKELQYGKSGVPLGFSFETPDWKLLSKAQQKEVKAYRAKHSKKGGGKLPDIADDARCAGFLKSIRSSTKPPASKSLNKADIASVVKEAVDARLDAKFAKYDESLTTMVGAVQALQKKSLGKRKSSASASKPNKKKKKVTVGAVQAVQGILKKAEPSDSSSSSGSDSESGSRDGSGSEESGDEADVNIAAVEALRKALGGSA